jgi:hypothetical protein
MEKNKKTLIVSFLYQISIAFRKNAWKGRIRPIGYNAHRSLPLSCLQAIRQNTLK